jgi:2-hydroxychromene-2-carboxylate isomerase
MKHITFYLDFISPYAYLAFERLPEALMGQSYSVTYKPILFAALLKHHGQLGPAEIAPKRDWTYRQVQWLAHSQGVALQLPAAHPFNPLGLLRLAVACGVQEGGLQEGRAQDDAGSPSRFVVETLFHHVWQGGGDAASPARLAEVSAMLVPARDANGDRVKAQLKANTEEAIALGVFGVPTLQVDDKLFWGSDALPMLRDYMRGDAWFDGPAWRTASQLPVGAVRPK